MTTVFFRCLACLAALLSAGLFALPVGSGEAAQPRRAVIYQGKTQQGRRIQLRVRGNTVTVVRFKVRLRCLDGGLLYADLSDFEPARLDRRGRFSDLQFGASDEVALRGKLRRRMIRGRLRVKDRLGNGVSCDSGNVGFAARPGRS